jgi:hypothetical protein
VKPVLFASITLKKNTTGTSQKGLNLHRGFIKLYRKILDSEIFYKPEHLQLFLYLLINANHEPGKVRGIDVKRGQHLTGRKQLSTNLNYKESTTYKRLLWLKDKKFIALKSNNQSTMVSICNYDSYQDKVTTARTTEGQRGNTNKNEKNYKKKIYGEYKHVRLTDEQHQKLKNLFNGAHNSKIKNLDEYIQRTGKNYKDHYLTILTWERKNNPETFSTTKPESIEEYKARIAKQQ